MKNFLNSISNLFFKIKTFQYVLIVLGLVSIGFVPGLFDYIKCRGLGRLEVSVSSSRPLAAFNEKISFLKMSLESEIKKRYIPQKTKILEFGFGQGRVLMELFVMFPDAKYYGINKEPFEAMCNNWSLFETCDRYKIKQDYFALLRNPPKLFFFNADGAKLPFESNSIDVIYSQHAIQFLEQKDVFLEEAWRILSVGGIALLHINEFYLIKNERIIPLQPYLKQLKEEGSKYIDVYKNILILRKDKNVPLGLNKLLEKDFPKI